VSAVIAAWPPFSVVRLGIGVLLAALLIVALRRLPAAEPEPDAAADTESLRAQGYLPFGVGLAIAAFILGILVGAPAVNAAFSDYARSIGL